MNLASATSTIMSSARPLYHIEEHGASAMIRQLADPLTISILATMIGAFIAVLAVRSIMRNDERRGRTSSRRLMRAMALPIGDRRLLRRLVRQSDVPNAACLLISRGCFDRAAEHADLSQRERAHCVELGHRLFPTACGNETMSD